MLHRTGRECKLLLYNQIFPIYLTIGFSFSGKIQKYSITLKHIGVKLNRIGPISCALLGTQLLDELGGSDFWKYFDKASHIWGKFMEHLNTNTQQCKETTSIMFSQPLQKMSALNWQKLRKWRDGERKQNFFSFKFMKKVFKLVLRPCDEHWRHKDWDYTPSFPSNSVICR